MRRCQETYGMDEIIYKTADTEVSRPEDVHKLSIELGKWHRRDARRRMAHTLKTQDKKTKHEQEELSP